MKKVTITLILLCAAALAQEKGTFTDSRDGKTYNTVKIGEQTWMAQNLNYKLEKGGSRCYNDNEARCDKYGRLYDWNGAKTACPSGWHLPSDEEWNKLSLYVDGQHVNHIIMNQKWNFSILLSGIGDFYSYPEIFSYNVNNSIANFAGVKENEIWWTATEWNADKGKYRLSNIGTTGEYFKRNLLSVRCLKD